MFGPAVVVRPGARCTRAASARGVSKPFGTVLSPHRSEVKSPQFPKPSDPRFQMRFLCVRNFIPNENSKLKQYAAYNFRHNILPTPLPLQSNVRFHIGTFRREIHQAKEHILRPQSDCTTCPPFPPTSFRRTFPHVKW